MGIKTPACMVLASAKRDLKRGVARQVPITHRFPVAIHFAIHDQISGIGTVRADPEVTSRRNPEGGTAGLPWSTAVAPGGIKEPTLPNIRAFRIPPRAFIALHRGTWHAGPYFTEGQRDFYNLELADTNTADYTTCHLAVPARFAT